jgi:hypothetical protein
MSYRIPEAVLGSHIAVLGMTGSGKTSTAKLIIEQVVADGHRVCILDPVKSDWWGITSSASGKREGLPFKILGGPHGHIPLPSSAGKVIGQLVGTGKLPLAIIDMADFEAGGLQRFFCDFAPALLRSVRGVVYLVVEEAHEFAPKERAGFGKENLALHFAKKLATAGRSKGIRIVVATQRTQSLHNALLGSCLSLIAHRLMLPADQDPVLKWLKGNVKEAAVRREIEDTMSSLPDGTGWLCSGVAKIFECIAFPRIRTFDNTATPDKESGAIDVKTAAVDHNELRTLIGDAVAEAEANDVPTLKGRIVELELELRKLATGTFERATAAAQELMERTAAESLARGKAAGYAEGFTHGRDEVAQQLNPLVTEAYRKLDEATTGLREQAMRSIADISTLRDSLLKAPDLAALSKLPKLRGREDLAAGLDNAYPIRVLKAPPDALPPFPLPMPSRAPESASPAKLARGPQAILNALAWWRVGGQSAPTLAQVGFVAGYSHTSSTFDTLRSRAKSAGLIEYPVQGRMRLTEEGARLAVAPAQPPTMIDYHDRVRAKLSGPLQKFFDALIGRKTLTLEELAEATGYSFTSSTFDTLRSRLKSLDLVSYPERGKVRISDWLYP